MTTSENKATVIRFNKEFLGQGNIEILKEIVANDFINHTAPEGSPKGPEGVIYFFNHLLKPSFPDLKVIIHDQVAEGDKVTTRKSFHATHTGTFFGIKASNKPVVMDVIDIIKLRNAQFVDHWGILDMQSILAQIS